MIRVIIVIPLTGLVPTIAIALAATVVKRNDITATITRPTKACQKLSTTPPRPKKQNTASRVSTMPQTTVFMGMSCWVRSTLSAGPPLRRNSPTARPTALFMTPALLIMPMIPATATPPMPMWRAYSENIWSGDICDTVRAWPVPMRSMTCPPHIRFIRGIITNHTRNEPQHITNAYLRPTM